MVHQATENISLDDGSLQKARLFAAVDMQQSDVLQFAGRKLGVLSQRSPTKTTDNEDAAAVIPWGESGGVMVVADGLGGAALGEEAAALAIRRVRLTVEQADPQLIKLRTAILNGIEAANRDVLELGRGAATTLAVAEVNGDTVRHYHVGDSGILVCGGQGKIKVQTVAHSPVGYGVESGMLDADDAMHHEDRHVVSNVVGMADMRIEIGSEVKLAARDTLLLASDGLFDNLQIDEIVQTIRKGPIRKACDSLQQTARDRMLNPTPNHPSKPDDLTFLVWR